MLSDAIRYLRDHEDDNLARLGELLRIPSISTDASHKNDVRRAAHWIHEFFNSCGVASRILETEGHPCVMADSDPSGRPGPILLVYGHYDVQPVGDLAFWETPPFEPDVRNGSIFARGASDDKGQLFTHLLAAEAWLKTAGSLPVRVKYLIEGEEEIGSPSIQAILADHGEELSCDYVVVSDGWKFDANTPSIEYAARGFLGKEIVLTGPSQDLHSGAYGGAVTNPGTALASIVAALHDDASRVTIPGFYDDVAPLGKEERDRLASLPFDEAAFLASTGSPCLCGESGFSTLERCWVRPTLEVNGLHSGFTADGLSSIVPATASAKMSMRLVPNQDPVKVSKAFDEFVRRKCPPGVRLEIIHHPVAPPYVAPIDTLGMQAAAEALEAGFDQRPLFNRAGGSLPILSLFEEALGADTLMLGFGIPGCNMHGPNEFLVIDDFHAGARTATHLAERFAGLF